MAECTKEDHERRASRYPFCMDCGISLVSNIKTVRIEECPHCGKVAHVSWKYCGWCGNKLRG